MADPASTWEIVSSVATAIGTLLSGGGLIYLARQIQLQRADSRLGAINTMLSEINTPDQRKALRFLYSKEAEELVWNKLSEPEREHAEVTIAHLGRLGFRLRHYPDLAEARDEAYELFSDAVMKSAQQLQPFLKEQYRLRGYHHAEDYMWLAREFKIRQLRAKNALPDDHEKLGLSDLLKIQPLPIWLPTTKTEGTVKTEGPPV